MTKEFLAQSIFCQYLQGTWQKEDASCFHHLLCASSRSGACVCTGLCFAPGLAGALPVVLQLSCCLESYLRRTTQCRFTGTYRNKYHFKMYRSFYLFLKFFLHQDNQMEKKFKESITWINTFHLLISKMRKITKSDRKGPNIILISVNQHWLCWNNGFICLLNSCTRSQIKSTEVVAWVSKSNYSEL